MQMIAVNCMDDVGKARNAAVAMGKAIGFDKPALADLELAVSELATNLVVHRTIDGEILLSEVQDALGRGLEIVSRDQGPGIADIELALKDRQSSRGSMGCGFGAVKRQMDEFDIYSRVPPMGQRSSADLRDQAGTLVTTRKWLVSKKTLNRFEYSINSRPMPGEQANGDCAFVSVERDGLLVAVADGLGHGPEAAKASRVAMEYIRENRRMAFEQLIEKLHTRLKGTRGIALTLNRILTNENILIHAGIGNVETRVYPCFELHLIPRPGVVGTGIFARPKVTKVAWPGNGFLVIFSDGISGRWSLSENENLLQHHVITVSHHLFHTHARKTDDATLVVVKEVAP